MGVAARYVGVSIVDVAKTVQHVYEFIHHLHLVDDDVVKILVLDSFVDIVKHHIRISQFFVQSIFKVNANNVIVRHTILQKVVIEQHVQKVRLSTSADSCYHFDKAIATTVNQLAKISVSFDFNHTLKIFANIGNFLQCKVNWFNL